MGEGEDIGFQLRSLDGFQKSCRSARHAMNMRILLSSQDVLDRRRAKRHAKRFEP
jgi:hypothetical protein